MTKRTMNELSKQFVDAAFSAYNARKSGNSKGIDAGHNRMREIYCQLRDEGAEGLATLKRLTEHENPYVRSNAASFFLWVDMPHAMLVLERTADEYYDYPEHTMEKAGCGSARLTYSLVAQRGEPMSADPYIKWKEKQQAKEQK